MIVLNTIMLESELPGTIFRSLSFPQSQSPPPPNGKIGKFYWRARFRRCHKRAQSNQRICLSTPAKECTGTCSGINMADMMHVGTGMYNIPVRYQVPVPVLSAFILSYCLLYAVHIDYS